MDNNTNQDGKREGGNQERNLQGENKESISVTLENNQESINSNDQKDNETNRLNNRIDELSNKLDEVLNFHKGKYTGINDVQAPVIIKEDEWEKKIMNTIGRIENGDGMFDKHREAVDIYIGFLYLKQKDEGKYDINKIKKDTIDWLEEVDKKDKAKLLGLEI